MKIRTDANAWLLIALIAAALPAHAEYASYRGEAVIQSDPKNVCSVLAGDSRFAIRIVGRNDAPGTPVDAYLTGDKLISMHLSGNAVTRLSALFPAETDRSRLLQLRPTGQGSFSGSVPIQTVVGAISGCAPIKADIAFQRDGGAAQADYGQAVRFFSADEQAVRAFGAGMQGHLKQAFGPLESSLADKRAILGESHPQLIPYEYFLAQLHAAAGSYAARAPLYQAALSGCDKAYGEESACSVLMLTSLGDAHLMSGEYPEAEAAARRALDVCQKLLGKDGLFCGIPQNGLAAAWLDLGRYGEASALLLEALDRNRSAFGPDNVNVGVSLTNLGVLYRFLGDYDKAERFMQEALAVDTKTTGAKSPLSLQNSITLAQIERLEGRYPQAESRCRQALSSAEEVLGAERPDHPALGAALLCLAETLRDTRRYQEAEPLYREALKNAQKYLGSDSADVAVISLLLARNLRESGRADAAVELLKSAYRIAQLNQNAVIGWRVSAQFMQVYAEGSHPKPDLAIFYGKEAVNGLQALRGSLDGVDRDAQRAFVGAKEVSGVYTALADLLVRQGRVPEAQQVLAMLKEQELYSFTRAAEAKDPRRTVAVLSQPEQDLDALKGKEIALGAEYAALKDKFAREHSLNAQDTARKNALRKAIDAAQSNFEAQVERIATAGSDSEAVRRRRQEITDLSRAFQGTLKQMGHDAVLAQYFILEDKVAVLLTTPSAVAARESPIQRRDLNERIWKLRAALSNPASEPTAASRALYDILIAPIEHDLQAAGAKTLMLSLDDTLRYVPFAALYDGHQYLVEKVSLAMVNEAVRDKLAAPPLDKWSVWALGVTQAHDGAPALPNVGIELNAIAGPKGILSGKVLLDGAFNEESLRDGLDQSYPIIHIASHFKFESGSMEESVLLLGDGSRLTLARIKNDLNFNGVELLTLSACETAVGDEYGVQHGIEVEGLGALAQQAGAKAVIASLWSVADGSTALLMRNLYQSRRDAHLTKAEALQAAQLALLKGGGEADLASLGARGLGRIAPSRAAAADPKIPFAHPFYWAPFILMGNWQ